MQFSKSTGYALHALVHLARSQRGRNVGIRELATLLGVPESYLSKIMSKLRQDGIVRAVPGAGGGYELARPADQITFLDVIEVIEGRQRLYECYHTDTQQYPALLMTASAETPEPDRPQGKGCLIRQAMDGAEHVMRQYLQQHTIQWVLDAAASPGPEYPVGQEAAADRTASAGKKN